ncbi:glutathione S-transferase omega-1-like isoform X2 [Moschus berezovskii]|uniref:glutathione S-transferase omega-1-like isoform X2 n=1 Tax=Moschus berezovskii TaxID=68408 RepID=UPI0024450EED|nr:glutathione S-transferase omega-1-like isoform X2 [Moschus berezovskii]
MSGGTVRSLGKGSDPPGPVPEGLIRVYSMRFCPFAKRTLLVLRAKGIRHEVININLKNKPEWFFKKNPSGLVPVLETSLGQLICESAITCEYLDEAYPGKKLLPGDPYEKACQKMVFESFSKVPSLMVGFLGKQNKEDCSGLKEELHKEFSKLEEESCHLDLYMRIPLPFTLSVRFLLREDTVPVSYGNSAFYQVHHEEHWAGRSTSWNQDCWEKYQ